MKLFCEECFNTEKMKDLKVNYTAELKKLSGFSDAAIANLVGVSVSTIRYYRSQNPALKASTLELLNMLISLFESGVKLFGSSEKFKCWLNRENFFFDKSKPVTKLDTISGIRFVQSRVIAMEFGDNV